MSQWVSVWEMGNWKLGDWLMTGCCRRFGGYFVAVCDAMSAAVVDLAKLKGGFILSRQEKLIFLDLLGLGGLVK